MEIYFIRPYLHGPSAARFIQDALSNGFKHEGYNCQSYSSIDIPKINEIKSIPDILFCDIVSSPFESKDFLQKIYEYKNAGSKIVIWLYWPLSDLPDARTQAIKNTDIADLYIGERESDAMNGFEAETGYTYHTLPMFAHSGLHMPVEFSKKFSFDVAFVGAKLPKKKWFNNNIIKPLKKKYSMGLYGTNWTIKDNLKRVFSKSSRIMKLQKLAKQIDKSRFTISDADEISLYSSSKICLNFHERENDLSQPHHIVNYRAFKITACGGFQICDKVEGLDNYFKDDELCRVDVNQKSWFEKIEYFINNPIERQSYIQKGIARIRKEHLDFHRVRKLESLLNIKK